MAEIANVGSRQFWDMLEKAYHDGTFEPHHYEWLLVDTEVQEGDQSVTRTCLRIVPARPGESPAEFPFRGEPGPETDRQAARLIQRSFGNVTVTRVR